MSATLIIVFREVLEASLVVGIVLAATEGIPRRLHWITLGLVGGVCGAILVAAFAGEIANLASGMGQEVFNSAVLFGAVAMLGWHNVWMSRAGRSIAGELKAAGASIRSGERPIYALAIVVGIAVLREGSEIVLFLYGIAAAQGTGAASMLIGGAIGLGLGVASGAVIYFGLVKFAGRYLFSVTSVLVLLLAAGMAAQGANFLVQAGYLPALGQQLWNTSGIISDRSALGNLLRVLIGYTARPEGIQIVFYIATLAVIGGLMKFLPRPRPAAKTVASALVIALAAPIGTSLLSPAKAEDLKVYSPIVEQREYAIEMRGNIAFDNDPSKDGAINQLTELEITPLSFWHTAILGEVVKDPPESLKLEATGWENIFQLTPQGKYWLDLGAYVEYDWAQQRGASDTLEWKILAEKNVGRLTFTANPIFETTLGGVQSGETEFRYATRVKWRYRPELEPAIEYYGTAGDVADVDRWQDQSQQIGPVFLGALPLGALGTFKYETGYLFGLTSGSPDGALKLSLELERYF